VRTTATGFYGFPTHLLSTAGFLLAADFDGDSDGDLLGGQTTAQFTGSDRNQGGHAAVGPELLADLDLAAGEAGTVLALDLEHGGTLGDPAVELATLAVQLTADGVPVDTSTLLSLVEALEAWRDDGNGVRDAGDTLVTRQTSLTADLGRVELVLPDGDPSLQLGWAPPELATPARLWLDLDLAPGAGAAGVTTLEVDFDAETGGGVESALYDLPLVVERERPFHVEITILDPGPFFADGFESGDTSAWSLQSPP
jgi:hypothetical protein